MLYLKNECFNQACACTLYFAPRLQESFALDTFTNTAVVDRSNCFKEANQVEYNVNLHAHTQTQHEHVHMCTHTLNWLIIQTCSCRNLYIWVKKKKKSSSMYTHAVKQTSAASHQGLYSKSKIHFIKPVFPLG